MKLNRRLSVDSWLRVLMDPSKQHDSQFGSILAMGDCAAISGSGSGMLLPQTAQVAAQQGAYVARLLNRQYAMDLDIPTLTPNQRKEQFTLTTILRVRGLLNAKPFDFLNMGLLAYIGNAQAVAQVQLGDTEFLKTAGNNAFLLWRSVYIVKQVSTRTRFLVLFDFMKTKIFGRDLTGL